MAKISIIVPVYNVEEYIERCLKSILKQTYKDYEIILIDDGSTDQSGQICDMYSEEYEHIMTIHQDNGGLSAARNTGIEWAIKNSDSQYITFIDSDDWIHNQFLEILLRLLEESHVSVSICDHLRLEKYDAYLIKKGNENYIFEVLSPEDLLISHQWNFNYAWAKLYKKELFEDVRYPNGKIYEDVHTTYKVLFADDKVAFTSAQLYYYFLNYEGITKSKWTSKELSVFEGMQKQLDFYKENNYEKALKKEQELYVHHLAYQINRIKENKENYQNNKKYLKKIKRSLYLYLIKNPIRYRYKNMSYCYESLFPRIFKIYHYIGKVIRQ